MVGGALVFASVAGSLLLNQLASTSQSPTNAVAPTTTAGKYQITVRRVADVSGMKMDMEFDLSRIQVQAQGQAFGNAQATGFAGGAAGGAAGTFTKPNVGIAIDIQSSASTAASLIEVHSKVQATDDQGRMLASKEDGPGIIHFAEFEAAAPGAYFIYVVRADDGTKRIKQLEGTLQITPAVVAEVTFQGPDFAARKTQRVRDKEFTLESVKRSEKGIDVTVACPPTQRQARARTPQERFQALSEGRGTYAAELVDNTGQIHRSTGGNAAGGGGFTQFGFGGPAGGKQGVAARQPAAYPSQSFHFETLPDDRRLASVRVRMVERTGPAQTVPFKLEDIAIP